MPIFTSTGCTPNDTAIFGMAVTITVPSRFSMKNAPATRSAIVVLRDRLPAKGAHPADSAVAEPPLCPRCGHEQTVVEITHIIVTVEGRKDPLEGAAHAQRGEHHGFAGR